MGMATMTLHQIMERLKFLDRPDRELDAHIHAATGAEVTKAVAKYAGPDPTIEVYHRGLVIVHGNDGRRHCLRAPEVTKDIDKAKALIEKAMEESKA